MDQYLTNRNARSIPIIVKLNKEGQEIAKWGLRSPFVQSLVDTLKHDIPLKDSPDHLHLFKQFISTITEKFTSDESLWTEVKQNLFRLLGS